MSQYGGTPSSPHTGKDIEVNLAHILQNKPSSFLKHIFLNQELLLLVNPLPVDHDPLVQLQVVPVLDNSNEKYMFVMLPHGTTMQIGRH